VVVIYNTTFNTKEDLLLATHCLYIPCHSYNKQQLPLHSPLTEWPSNGSKLCSLCCTNRTSTIYNNVKGVGLLGDVVHTCNAGVSYFLNIIRPTKYNFIYARKKATAFPALFAAKSQMLNNITFRSFIRNFTQIEE